MHELPIIDKPLFINLSKIDKIEQKYERTLYKYIISRCF